MMFRAQHDTSNKKSLTSDDLKQRASWLKEICEIGLKEFDSQSVDYANISTKISVYLEILKLAYLTTPAIFKQELEGKPFIYHMLKKIISNDKNRNLMSTLMRYILQHSSRDSIEYTHSLLMQEWQEKIFFSCYTTKLRPSTLSWRITFAWNKFPC